MCVCVFFFAEVWFPFSRVWLHFSWGWFPFSGGWLRFSGGWVGLRKQNHFWLGFVFLPAPLFSPFGLFGGCVEMQMCLCLCDLIDFCLVLGMRCYRLPEAVLQHDETRTVLRPMFNGLMATCWLVVW